jgi:hypothetical protein
MKKISAVEWLVNELQKSKDYQRVINEVNQGSSATRDIISEAKAMEKQQMKDMLFQKTLRPFKFNFEEYYNETYNK